MLCCMGNEVLAEVMREYLLMSYPVFPWEMNVCLFANAGCLMSFKGRLYLRHSKCSLLQGCAFCLSA